jgi:hypothetical protein
MERFFLSLVVIWLYPLNSTLPFKTLRLYIIFRLFADGRNMTMSGFGLKLGVEVTDEY